MVAVKCLQQENCAYMGRGFQSQGLMVENCMEKVQSSTPGISSLTDEVLGDVKG